MAMYGFSGSPWSIPNVVIYLVGGAVMEEVESNVTGVDPIMLDTGTELVAAALKPGRGVRRGL
jgi:hypothetical protein